MYQEVGMHTLRAIMARRSFSTGTLQSEPMRDFRYLIVFVIGSGS